MTMKTVAQAEPAAMPASFTPARAGLLQRKCACGGTPGREGECAECRKKRLSLQRRSASQVEPTTVPPIVNEVLRSPGQPLDEATGAFMEPRFGHDFSQVRVHTDAKAIESARTVNALAYTVEPDRGILIPDARCKMGGPCPEDPLADYQGSGVTRCDRKIGRAHV